MPDILHFIKIKAPPERVYAALTTPAGIHNWWTRQASLDSQIGGTGEFRFYGGKGMTQIRIDSLTTNRHVGWTTISSNAPGGWDDTRITFDLRAEDGGTALLFAHRGFMEESEGFALVSTGWAYYLISLQQYLETGEGAPQQDKDFSIAVKRRAVNE